MHYNLTFWVLVAVIFCFTYVNGFHDGCNAVATLIASRAMSPHKALAFAAIIEFLSPFTVLLIGAGVAETMKSIVNESAYSDPALKSTALAFVTAGIVAAIVWNVFTWAFGIPASSSHALIGGVIGSGMAAFGINQIGWHNVLIKVVLMLFLTPVIGLITGYLVMKIIKYMVRSVGPDANMFFIVAQRLNMTFLAFNHSFNDSQKSVGIIMLLMGIMGFTQQEQHAAMWWVLAGAALALSLGIAFGGFKIIKTVGTGIYKVKPIHSFASQLTAGSVIFISSLIGAPVSASQIVSSSIMGVGSAERVNAVRWDTVKKILFSWVFTLPVVALFGALFFYAFALIF